MTQVELPLVSVVVVDCLGRERRPEKIYPDGSWNCPFCWAAVVAGTPEHEASACPNPGCFARGPSCPFPRAEAERLLAEQERRAREQKEREDLNRERERLARERVEARDRQVAYVSAEAERRGACERCAERSTRFGGAPKYTRHRLGCPQLRR